MKRVSLLLVLLMFGMGGTAIALGDEVEFPTLLNGDTNGDGDRDLSDAVHLLGYLYLGGPAPVPILKVNDEPILENGDTNGDGTLDISDPIRLLGWLFSGGPAPELATVPEYEDDAAGGAACFSKDPIRAVYTFPDIGVAEIEPQFVTNDRNIDLGGVGSDLWHDRCGPKDEFWMVTDKGAGWDLGTGGSTKVIPIPEYTPVILKVKTKKGGAIDVKQVIPIVNPDGTAVTGLPTSSFDNANSSYDCVAFTDLGLNPSALDPEGFVRTSTGDFWICEEHSPSLVHVDKKGQVVARYVPNDAKLLPQLAGAKYPIIPALPGIFATRRTNRGFEGLALSGDEKTLYIVLQSPLDNYKKAGRTSRNTRILVFDIATESVVAEYVYQLEEAKVFDPATTAKDDPATPADEARSEMKISALTALPLFKNYLLVLERTDALARVYVVNLKDATNILGTQWDVPAKVATDPMLEKVEDPAAQGIAVLPKKLFADTSMDEIPDKIEGMALVDALTLALTNDNDFGVTVGADGNTVLDPDCKNVDSGVQSEIFFLNLWALWTMDL